MTVSSPTDKAKIKKMMFEISNSFTRISAEKDLIKETIADLSKEFEIPKRTLNRMAKIYHKQSYSQEQQEFEEFGELYENILETNNS